MLQILRKINYVFYYKQKRKNGSGALPGKMLLERIIENTIIDANFKSC